jgi:hypothetical protein
MDFFKDRSDVSKDNILKPTLENLSSDEQQQFQYYIKKGARRGKGEVPISLHGGLTPKDR